jgi:hypothetical protein
MLFLILLVLSFITSYLLPWWAVPIVTFFAAYFMANTSKLSFISGFSAVFLVWALLAALKSIPNDHILAGKVVQLFPLPHHWIWVLIVTAVIGGLIGGMGALSGALMKRAFGKYL